MKRANNSAAIILGTGLSILWFTTERYFRLQLSALDWSLALLLLIMLFGLGLGALLDALLPMSRRKPGLGLGRAFLVAGLTGSVMPRLVPALASLHQAMDGQDPGSPGALVFKVGLGSAMLLPLGIPGGYALAQLARRTGEGASGALKILALALGSAALAAALFPMILPGLGLELTSVAMGLVLILGGIILVIIGKLAGAEPMTRECPGSSPEPILQYALFGLYLGMVFEPLHRILSLALVPSSQVRMYADSGFAAGLALGFGWVLMRGTRARAPILVGTQALVLAALVILSQHVPYGFDQLKDMVAGDSGYPLLLVLEFLAATIPMLLATAPLAAATGAFSLESPGRLLLPVVLSGSALGYLATTRVLLPLTDPWLTLSLGSGLLLIPLVPRLLARGDRLETLLSTLVAAGCLALVLVHPQVPELFVTGRWPAGVRFPGFREDYLRSKLQEEIIQTWHGPEHTAALLKSRGSDQDFRITLDGLTITDTYLLGPTAAELAGIPSLLHPEPRRVLAMGAGLMPLLQGLGPNLDELLLVETSPLVARAQDLAGLRAPEGLSPLSLTGDPGEILRLQEDARWDLILSLPPHPILPQAGDMLSQEFLTLAASRLATGGLFAQWIPAALDDRSILALLETFGTAFPHTTLWQVGPGELMLLGGNDPVTITPAALEARIKTRLPEHLPGFSSPLNLLSLQLLGERLFRRSFQGVGILNTDNYPHLEYSASQLLIHVPEIQDIPALDERKLPRARSGLLVTDYLGARTLSGQELGDLMAFLAKRSVHFSGHLLPSLLEAGLRSGQAPAGRTIFGVDDVFLFFGARELWRARMASGDQSGDEWLRQLDYEASVLNGLTTVFYKADPTEYLHALTRTRELLPIHKQRLDKLSRELFNELGLNQNLLKK